MASRQAVLEAGHQTPCCAGWGAKPSQVKQSKAVQGLTRHRPPGHQSVEDVPAAAPVAPPQRAQLEQRLHTEDDCEAGIGDVDPLQVGQAGDRGTLLRSTNAAHRSSASQHGEDVSLMMKSPQTGQGRCGGAACRTGDAHSKQPPYRPGCQGLPAPACGAQGVRPAAAAQRT